MNTIAFIGLGNMGGPMAENLLSAGVNVRVFDLMPEAVKTLESAGAYAASSISDVVKGAESIITMLPASKHVKDVYLGDEKGSVGLLDMVEDGAFLIDSSTIVLTQRKWLLSARHKRALILLMLLCLEGLQVQKQEP